MIAGHENQGALLWELNSPFKVDEIDVGDPVADEVEIRVHAAGMCHSDYHLTTGATPIAPPALGGQAIADGTSRVHAGSTEAAPMNLLGTFAPYMTVHKDSVVKSTPTFRSSPPRSWAARCRPGSARRPTSPRCSLARPSSSSASAASA